MIIFFEWDTMENARQFASSAALKEAMKRAGVIDKPDVYYLENVENLSQ